MFGELYHGLGRILSSEQELKTAKQLVASHSSHGHHNQYQVAFAGTYIQPLLHMLLAK